MRTNVHEYDDSILTGIWQGHDSCEHGQYLNIPSEFANPSAIIVFLNFWGAAGCSHLKGCGIYFCEYVYSTFSGPPIESTNSQCRISVTLMSRLMLNLRDPKVHTVISGRMTRTTMTAGRKHVCIYITGSSFVANRCQRRLRRRCERPNRYAKFCITRFLVWHVFYSLYWDGVTGSQCGPRSLPWYPELIMEHFAVFTLASFFCYVYGIMFIISVFFSKSYRLLFLPSVIGQMAWFYCSLRPIFEVFTLWIVAGTSSVALLQRIQDENRTDIWWVAPLALQNQLLIFKFSSMFSVSSCVCEPNLPPKAAVSTVRANRMIMS